MKRLLFITPHLSTGGLPQYLLKKVKTLYLHSDEFEIFVLEYKDISVEHIVQKEQLRNILKHNLYLAAGNNLEKLLKIIKPDIIHMEEIPELFMENKHIKLIYDNNRSWKIYETCHSATFDISKKFVKPDMFIHVGKWISNKFKPLNIPHTIAEYPVINVRDTLQKSSAQISLKWDQNKKHILNVGLFTPNKNQAKIFELAREFENEDVLFHFVGNLAPNFKDYWEPLLKNKPANCIIHGEKHNADYYYAASDLFLSTSLLENNPIVVKEAMSWQLPIFLIKLSNYDFEQYDEYGVVYLSDEKMFDVYLIKNYLGVK